MKIRTLIVDDEVLSRRGVEIRLRNEADFEILAQCANGREALAAIQQYKPDLVFLDIQMPGMSGFEVLAHLPQAAQHFQAEIGLLRKQLPQDVLV